MKLLIFALLFGVGVAITSLRAGDSRAAAAHPTRCKEEKTAMITQNDKFDGIHFSRHYVYKEAEAAANAATATLRTCCAREETDDRYSCPEGKESWPVTHIDAWGVRRPGAKPAAAKDAASCETKLDAANKMIAELKAKVVELGQHKRSFEAQLVQCLKKT